MQVRPSVVATAEEATARLMQGLSPFHSREDEIQFAVQVLQLMGQMVTTLEGLERRLKAMEERLERERRLRSSEAEEYALHAVRQTTGRVDPEARARKQAEVAAKTQEIMARERARDLSARLRMRQLLEQAPTVKVEWPFPDDTLHFALYSIHMRRGVNDVPEPAVADVQQVIERRLLFEETIRDVAVTGKRRLPYQSHELVQKLKEAV